MKACLTSLALTKGIVETDDANQSRLLDGMISVFHKGGYTMYYRKQDWSPTRDAAIARAEEMRVKKITSLRKQITKLENLKF